MSKICVNVVYSRNSRTFCYVRYIIYTSSIASGSMITLCRTADSFEKYIHKVYMLTAYSTVGAAVNSTKRAKSIILKTYSIKS